MGGKKYKLQLVYYDDESKKDNIASLYTKLVEEDGVDFLLAPYSSTLTLAALPVANEKGKLILSHGGASDSIVEQGYRYIVQVLTPASRYMETAAELVADEIPGAKIALIFENKPFAQKVKEGLKDRISELGLQVVYEADYEAGTKDFSTFIQEAINRGADVLLGGGHYEDGKALVGQAHSLGWKLKFLAILVAPAQPKFKEELGNDVVNGVAFSSQWREPPTLPRKPRSYGYSGLARLQMSG
ncbi:ABC transporter substrate-binding protein [Aeropyrum camini]|uniref:ABC-type branched-chain amino acid transporter n=1 Tax=Aeropyrum camini SY1 = JCM 12091 TaxID=1198449 RepID=U3TGB2_9CREN|nr:ABC-type branched-chain amino acid transporter [Aeropyrum camini SY1 = JCM 12091]